MTTMKVSDLAKAAGISRDSVRHYTRLGLIRAEKDPHNGYHRYTDKALRRIRFIRLAQGVGFRLQDIQLIFSHADGGASPCPQVRELIRERLQDGEKQLQQLASLLERMRLSLQLWQTMPNGTPNGDSICHLIESQLLQDEECCHEP